MLPIRLNGNGYPGTVMKYLFSTLNRGGNLQAPKTRVFTRMIPRTVAADGGKLGHSLESFLGGVYTDANTTHAPMKANTRSPDGQRR